MWPRSKCCRNNILAAHPAADAIATLGGETMGTTWSVRLVAAPSADLHALLANGPLEPERTVNIIGINDFHGQLDPTTLTIDGIATSVGGAAALDVSGDIDRGVPARIGVGNPDQRTAEGEKRERRFGPPGSAADSARRLRRADQDENEDRQNLDGDGEVLKPHAGARRESANSASRSGLLR